MTPAPGSNVRRLVSAELSYLSFKQVLLSLAGFLLGAGIWQKIRGHALLPDELLAWVAIFSVVLNSDWLSRERTEKRMRLYARLPVSVRDIARTRTTMTLLTIVPSALFLLGVAIMHSTAWPITARQGVSLLGTAMMISFLMSLIACVRHATKDVQAEHFAYVFAGFVILAVMFIAHTAMIVRTGTHTSMLSTPMALYVVLLAVVIGWRSEVAVWRGESLE